MIKNTYRHCTKCEAGSFECTREMHFIRIPNSPSVVHRLRLAKCISGNADIFTGGENT